jgi:hypothetical protein
MGWLELPDLHESNNWMALIAVLALVLSQFPPFVPWLWRRIHGGTVRISTQDSFALTHYLGRIGVTLFVQIENAGPSSVAVAKIDCIIRRVATAETQPGKTVWRFPGRTHQSEPSGNRIFLGTIRLKSEEHWQDVIHCHGPKSQADEEEEQTIQELFATYIGRTVDAIRAEGGEVKLPITVSDDLVARATAWQEKTFDITRGDYELFIAAIGRGGEVLGVTKSRFILYDNNIRIMLSITDGYQYGEGITDLVPTQPYRRFYTEPRLTPAGSDQAVRREYEAIIKN